MKKLIASIVAFAPSLAFAQPLTDINSVAGKATNIGNLVVELAISFAVIWIIVSVVRYLIAGGEDGRAKGRDAIVYGVIGLFVILSIWGLVYILRSSFRTQDNVPTQDINNIKIPRPSGV
ncbi:MAG: pilin [Patescibacteria group bacterium]